MTARSRRVALALGILAGILYTGRWGSSFLVERWWAAEVSGPGAVFTTRWTLLRIGLDAAGTVLAVAWFAGHLLLAARLAGRVAPDELSPSRQLSPLRPGLLRWWALGTAAVLGLLCGAGTAEWAPVLALASAGPRWGLVDPLQGMDAGFYVATLPLAIRFQQLALALTLLGFIASIMLYAIGGALRVAARQFVLDPGIRLHLGLLGAGLGLVLALGYFLEPYQIAAGLRPAAGTAHAVLLGSLSRVLVGFALAAAGLTAVWGIRGRTMLPVGAWAAFALFALVIRLLAPAAGAAAEGDRPAAEMRELEMAAFSFPDGFDGQPALPRGTRVESVPLTLWDSRTVAPDSGSWLAADQVIMPQGGVDRSVLLLVGNLAGRPGIGVAALAADQATVTGGPLAWRGDSIPYPGTSPLLVLPRTTVRPGAPAILVAPDAPGIVAGGLLRRLALTWALQTNLLDAAAGDRVAWRMDPGERLRAIAPFAEWSNPRPRIVADRLLWVSDGYLHATSFPGVAPVPWRGRSVSYLDAAFVGVVEAGGGKVRIYERGIPDPLAAAWTGLARGLVESDTALAAQESGALAYPGDLFAAQSLVLQRPHWRLGSLAGVPAGAGADSLAGPIRQAGFAGTDRRQLVVVVEARRQGRVDVMQAVRLDSLGSLETPAVLGPRFERLPFVQQMRDSVQGNGARLQLGPIRMAATVGGLVGWQAGHAVDSAGRGTLVLVNLAFGSRLGTGPGVLEAWQNLRGEVAAIPQSVGAAAQLRQARLWLIRADSAFRRGDLAAFGRAFEALRALLDYPPGTPR